MAATNDGERRWDEDGKASIDLRWRGMLIHAEPRDGRWMLSADGRKWIGPEVIQRETWGAATGRLRAWIDQYLKL